MITQSHTKEYFNLHNNLNTSRLLYLHMYLESYVYTFYIVERIFLAKKTRFKFQAHFSPYHNNNNNNN